MKPEILSRGELIVNGNRNELIIAFEVRERNPLFVLGVLCIIGFPGQFVREVF